MTLDIPTSRPRGLSLRIDVAVARLTRRRCPTCRRVRVLYQLVAHGASVASVGDSVALCGPCGGLR